MGELLLALAMICKVEDTSFSPSYAQGAQKKCVAELLRCRQGEPGANHAWHDCLDPLVYLPEKKGKKK